MVRPKGLKSRYISRSFKTQEEAEAAAPDLIEKLKEAANGIAKDEAPKAKAEAKARPKSKAPLPQSGLKNISWANGAWRVKFQRLRDGVKTKHSQSFPWRRHLHTGASVEEAKQKSLEEAREFRDKFIAEGTLKLPPKLGSEIHVCCLRTVP